MISIDIITFVWILSSGNKIQGGVCDELLNTKLIVYQGLTCP